MSRNKWTPFQPALSKRGRGTVVLSDYARQLAAIGRQVLLETQGEAIEALRRRASSKVDPSFGQDRQRLLGAMNVLADLAKQHWRVRVQGGRIAVARPQSEPVNGSARELVRAQLHAERDAQLRQRPVQAFIRGMETRRVYNGDFVSIFSLMRDGGELTASLAHGDSPEHVKEIIKPYLQFVDEDATCDLTGFPLVEIWRYFRHTWANPYRSIPGRTMMVLVRDAGAKCHPLIGIAAISSASVAVTARDEWIGWTVKGILEEVWNRPTRRVATWLQKSVDDAIAELYIADLIERECLEIGDLKQPSKGVISKLMAEAKAARAEHRRFMQSVAYKKAPRADRVPESYWLEQARTPLFRSKRALDLAQLLGVRIQLHRFFPDGPTTNGLKLMAADGAGRDAIAKVVRRAKAARVGTLMADITVCGAVPPYNELLGGKLIAAMLASPEVGREYQRRYGQLPSVIASSMAGRPITRPAHLAFLGTTSLYGSRPTQYDRICIPWGNTLLRYEYLGRTLGLGTFHFGDKTVGALGLLLAQSQDGQRVNSVFGEGVNPRLRKIRDGLNALKLPADELLNHGGPRLVYGLSLVANLRDFLLGLDSKPRYLLPQKQAAEVTRHIVAW